MYLWKNQYNSTLESLENKDPTPKRPHPNQMTKDETDMIEQIIKDKPKNSYLNLFGEIRREHAYNRHFMTFYKYARLSML